MKAPKPMKAPKIKLIHNLPELTNGQMPAGCIRVRFMSQWGRPMAITASSAGIHRLEFLPAGETIDDESPENTDRNIRNAIDHLAGQEVDGNIIVSPVCTRFRLSVYQALMQIPAGSTVRYKDVASFLGNPNSTRAVAGAIAKNDIAILIPCHRVVPATGGYGNYRWGAALKAEIIESERREKAKTLSED